MLHMSYVEGKNKTKTTAAMARYLCENAVSHVPLLLDVKIVQHPQQTVGGFTFWVFPFFFAHSVPAQPIMCEVICHCV